MSVLGLAQYEADQILEDQQPQLSHLSSWWPDFRHLAAAIIMCAVVIDVVAACATNVVTHDAKRPDGCRPSTSELGP
jgi:hypothetical protein